MANNESKPVPTDQELYALELAGGKVSYQIGAYTYLRDDKAQARRALYEAGRKEGYELGHKEGYFQGKAAAYELGFKAGQESLAEAFKYLESLK